MKEKKGRRGIPIIANSPKGTQKTFLSKRAACRAIGCRMPRLDRVLRDSEPILVEGEYCWMDELREG